MTEAATDQAAPRKTAGGGRGHAILVAAGIFLSRIAGFARVSIFAHYFGNTDPADAFNAALRIPNFLQNLFGEGVLSASLIPVYASLLARDRKKEATEVAGAIASLLGLMISVLVLLGLLATPLLIDMIAPGFEGEKRLLTIRLVRIIFPGTGMLVMSAWCLGILNSHHKFFLSYSAPVLWNFAIIAALVFFGGKTGESGLAVIVAWSVVAGSVLQFVVQLPVTLRLLGALKLSLDTRAEAVRQVIRNFVPVVTARGVVQISAYIDSLLASLLPTGGVSALVYAQTLYLLPVSLFGMSVSAAELPAMSSAVGSAEEIAAQLRVRLESGLRQIALFIVPSAMAFLALGDVIASAVYQSGKFTHADTLYVWATLAGSTIGLLAQTLGRLYASTFYALRDTKTPLKYAVLRVLLTTGLGYVFALKIPPMIGIDLIWGVAGLTSSAGIAAWIEFLLLRRALNARIGRTGVERSYVLKLWTAAALAAAAGFGVKYALGGALRPAFRAVAVFAPYGIVYFGVLLMLGTPEIQRILSRFLSSRRK